MGLIALLFVMSGCGPGAPASAPTAPLPTSTSVATPKPTAIAPSLATPAATIPATASKTTDHASPPQTPEALDDLQEAALPAGFVTQIIEPLGGKILPKGLVLQ